MAKPKVLYLDIETAPKRAFIWTMWKQNTSVDKLITDTYVLCWAAKWEGSRELLSDAVWNYKDEENDLQTLRSLYALLNEADVIVAHNGDRFDIPVINSRFVIHSMEPPSPTKQVDTLKIARRMFKFTSNRLDDLGLFLGVGRKLKTDMSLWIDVLAGKKVAQNKMLRYNKRDVTLLERVYKKIRAWDNRHPSLSTYIDSDRPVCNVCGGTHVHKKGVYYTNARVYPRFKCVQCGHNMRGRYSETKKEQAKNNLVSV